MRKKISIEKVVEILDRVKLTLGATIVPGIALLQDTI